MIVPTLEQLVTHIQKNERELDLVDIQFAIDKWWVQLMKGSTKSRPAVHENLVDAYAIALGNFLEAENKL